MIRRPPRSTPLYSSAASDVYKRQTVNGTVGEALGKLYVDEMFPPEAKEKAEKMIVNVIPVSYTHLRAHET